MLKDYCTKGGLHLIKVLLVVFIFFLGVSSFLFAQLDFYHFDQSREESYSENTRLPGSNALAAIFLNYRTFAADLGWIQMIVDYGDQLAARHKNINLLHNGFVISELDPQFRHVYDWVPAAYLANNPDPTLSDMARLTKLIERGAEAFPSDGRLPFDIAVNYMGNSTTTSDYRELVESQIAISYLEKAITLPNTPDEASTLLEWFKNRREKILNKYENLPFNHPSEPWMNLYATKFTYKPDIEQLAKFILSTTDPKILENLRDELARSKDPASKKLIERVNELSHTFEDRYQKGWRVFVDPGVWATLVR